MSSAWFNKNISYDGWWPPPVPAAPTVVIILGVCWPCKKATLLNIKLTHTPWVTICVHGHNTKMLPPGPVSVNDKCQDDDEDMILYDKRWQEIWTLGTGIKIPDVIRHNSHINVPGCYMTTVVMINSRHMPGARSPVMIDTKPGWCDPKYVSDE